MTREMNLADGLTLRAPVQDGRQVRTTILIEEMPNECLES